MRGLVAVVLVGLAVLTGCAPDAGAGTQRVQVEGRITQVAAATGGRVYILEVAEQGVLPLDIEGRPPMSASGVVVEVPDSLDIPSDVAGRFAALDEYVRETEESLVVVDFLP
jgi:hypothetical protein